MSKTEWESYHRAPRGWILNDGQLVIEPLLEITAGGRRVRTDHHLHPTNGPTSRADDVAFTWVVKHAQDMGKFIMCQQHTPEFLMDRVRNVEGLCKLPSGPPLYHKVGNSSMEEAASGRWESNKTSFWSLYKHPDLPVWFISLIQVGQNYQGYWFERSLLHMNLFPQVEIYNELYNYPPLHKVTSQLNRGEGGMSVVHRPIDFLSSDFFERFQPGRRFKMEGLRAGLLKVIIEATRELQDGGLAVPDVWRAIQHDWGYNPTPKSGRWTSSCWRPTSTRRPSSPSRRTQLARRQWAKP